MKYGFLFPGQGSQKVGMGSMFQGHSIYEDYFSRANSALGFDLKKLSLEGPLEELTLSKNAQPAILTVSTIAHQIFLEEQLEIEASYMAGHSLGEYSALVATEVFDFSDAVQIVYRRGELMQKAVPEGVGAMAAILGKEDKEVEALCNQISTNDYQVNPANFNSKGQVVVSGHKEAVEKLLEKAKGKLLQVSAPFHCPLMSSIKKEFREFLSNFNIQKAKIPIINNVKGEVQTDYFLESLTQQIDSPVLWRNSIELMITNGIENFFEFGGNVLSGLCKRINKNISCVSIQDLESIDQLGK